MKAGYFHKKHLPKNEKQGERHLNQPLLPVVVVILGVLYVLTGYKGWLVFFIGTGGALLIAWLWTSSLTRNLWVERKIHLAWATVGESVPEQVKLINQSWLPALWVEITDQSEALESPVRMVSDAGQHRIRTRNLSHLFKRRGVYTLGPTHLRCGDPFGIYTLSMYDQHKSTILITPPVLQLSKLRIPSGGWTGDERYRSGSVERNISDAGLRNYVAGDSLRRIHWRASAHFDALIVRQQEAATSRDWCIYVDLDRDAQAGIGDHSTLELAVVLAASLAVRGLREFRRVGLVLAGPTYNSLEPSADPYQGWHILRTLSMAQAGEHSLADLIHQSPSNQAATVILITSTTNPVWVVAADRHFKTGNMQAILVDPTDFGSPINQNKVISALAQSRIPYTSMPGSLLDQAYSQAKPGQQPPISGSESLKRYLQQGRHAWQSMG
jgi:uncharacterized protein (DUF58 family)